MRTFIISIFLMSSTSFAACPDLTSSTKICHSTTGQTPGNENQKITQENINGITTYTFNYTSSITQEEVNTELIADGKSRREIQADEDSGISILTATTVTCGENKLLTHTTSFIDGQFLGVMDIETTKSGNIVTNVIEGMKFGRDIDDVVVCE